MEIGLKMESYVEGSCYVTPSGRKRKTAQISQDIRHVVVVPNVANTAIKMLSEE